MLDVYTRRVARRGFGNLRDRMCGRHRRPISRASFCGMAQYESIAEEAHSSGMSERDKNGHRSSHVRTSLFVNIRRVTRKSAESLDFFSDSLLFLLQHFCCNWIFRRFQSTIF